MNAVLSRAAGAAATRSAAAEWADSGLMALSGPRDGAPIVPAFDAMSRIDALLQAVAVRTGAFGKRVTLDRRYCTERVALQGLSRGGQVSCNRTCRLIEARDGWIAVNLPRSIDLATVPAFVGRSRADEPWAAIARSARARNASDMAESGQLLGLAVAQVPHARARDSLACAEPWPLHRIRFDVSPLAHSHHTGSRPLVIDLSALWAGPACTQVLAAAGARVIKVESVTRPDSIRDSSPVMFDLLHADKESVALDFTAADDRARLRELVQRADILVTSARPRAFDQLGLAPDDIFAFNPALTWIAITAYGWQGEAGQRIGFGDDAAAAGGLVGWLADGSPVFLGDALADPLTGLAAACAALEGYAGGGGTLVDVNLRGVAAWIAAARPLHASECGTVRWNNGQWQLTTPDGEVRVAEPCARLAARPAAALGADTVSVLRELTSARGNQPNSTNRQRTA